MSGSSELVVRCPGCETTAQLRGKAMTLALTCKSCGTYFRVGNWNRDVTKFQHKQVPAIPIGSKGKIENYLYEVVGFVVKRERKYRYSWREYLLFNPYRGYAFFSEYDGHWNFVYPIDGEPHGSGGSLSESGTDFRIYQRYSADVIYAEGEFFFDIVGLTASTSNIDYISPPYLLTVETSDDSILWCRGEYFQPAEVSSIFNIPVSKLPRKKGIGYTQPLIGSFSRSTLITVTIAILVVALLAQALITGNAQEKVVHHQTFNRQDLIDQKMFVTPSFELEGGTKSVEFYIEAPLDNDWFYGEFTLINEDDGSEYNFSKEFEFYHGYEDGESWTEGAKVGEAYISQIPEGKYHINIYPEFSVSNNAFSIMVTRDVPNMSNFFFTCLLILLFPIFYFIRGYYLEVKRWSESEYSPYE